MKLRLLLLALATVLIGWVQEAYAFYNPSTGRWLSRDPLAERGGINLYRFTHNSPANLIDTDGRGIRGAGIGAGIGGIIGGAYGGILGAAGGTLVLPGGGTIGGAGGLGAAGAAAGASLGGAIGNATENLWLFFHQPSCLPASHATSSPTGPPPCAVPGAPTRLRLGSDRRVAGWRADLRALTTYPKRDG